MQTTWDLTPLYQDETDPKIEEDIQTLLGCYDEIQRILTTSDAFEVKIVNQVLVLQQQASEL
ncbi:MAG: hypothetical protein ACRDD4_01845, partial [Culicoidibacterales bacterium]